jgi:[acyl-carrier-protein] S-malonyltransferase
MTLAILCPGQGHQHPGMFALFEHDSNARTVLDDAASALGADPRAWLREPGALHRNRIAQPLICVVQLAAWRALRDRLPRVSAFAGYSVGELASYGCADALDTPDLCRLAQARARMMDDANRADPGKLLALHGVGIQELTALCAGRDAWPAIVLDDTSFVVGGRVDAIDALADAARAQGARVHCLSVDVPSHTPLLAGAIAPFRAALEASRLRNPSIPVFAGIGASLVTRRSRAIDVLSRQLAQPIEWARVMQALRERGCRVFLELPPGNALSRMMRERFADVEARAVDDFRSLDGIAAWAQSRLA